MEITSLVVAAGKGTRMKSDLPKVIHKANGVPMVKKIVSELEEMGIKRNILILGHKIDVVLKEFEENEVEYVVQEEQLGTGHAVIMAKEKLANQEGNVLIVCGDTPLLKSETLKELCKSHDQSGAACTVMTATYNNPFGYGRIVKENELVKAIVEEKEASDEVKKIKEVNSGVYCFNIKKLFTALDNISNDNEKGEYYLTDAIKILVDSNEKVESYCLEDNEEILGVNSKVQLAEAARVLRRRKNEELMAEGVTLIDPAATYIEEGVVVGKDTTIQSGAYLHG